MTKYRRIRQHYIPRFYLKTFARKTKPKTYRIRCFDKYKYKPLQCNINDIAVEKFFYDSEIPTQVEYFLSLLEREFARVYKKIINHNSLETMTSEDYTIFSVFIFTQQERTKSSRIRNTQIAKQIYKFLYLNNPELNLPPFESLDVEYRKKVLNLLARNNQLRFMFSTFMEDKDKGILNPAKAIFNLEWTLCTNDTGFEFYTSDHPIFIYNPDRQEVPLQGYGQYAYSSQGVRIYFPLTPTLCLELYDGNFYPFDKKKGNKKQIKKEMVDLINTHIIIEAYRYIFSKGRDFKFVKTLLKEDPTLRDPNRNRLIIYEEGLKWKFGKN